MMKKAQGLTFNTLAVAAIVIIVIIVVLAIFTGTINKYTPFLKERGDCDKQGFATSCEANVRDCEAKGGSAIYGLGCDKKDSTLPYCCVRK